MAIASLVLGILSLLLSWIPVLSIIALVPCILSFIFGIIAISKSNINKAMSITGIITSVMAFGIIVFTTFLSWLFVSAIGSINQNTDFDLDFGNSEFHYERNSRKELYSTYSINEDIKLRDRIVKVEKVEKTQGNENYKPVNDNEFVLVTVSMKNVSMYNILYDCDNFILLDKNNNEYESDYNKIKSNTTFSKGSIKTGKIVTGVLCFEVPKESEELTLQFENYINCINISLD